MSGAVKAVLLSHDLIPDVEVPSQIYIEESCRETGTVTAMRYDLTAPAPHGICEALHTGTAMTDRQCCGRRNFRPAWFRSMRNYR